MDAFAASKAVVENTEMYDALSSIPNEKLEIVQPIVEAKECVLSKLINTITSENFDKVFIFLQI